MGELKKPQRSTLSIPGTYYFLTMVAKLQRCFLDFGVEGWRLYACNSGGHGDAKWASVVMGLPESAVKAFQVRQNRIPWRFGQVRVRVGDAKPPGKDSKEKKGAGK